MLSYLGVDRIGSYGHKRSYLEVVTNHFLDAASADAGGSNAQAKLEKLIQLMSGPNDRGLLIKVLIAALQRQSWAIFDALVPKMEGHF